MVDPEELAAELRRLLAPQQTSSGEESLTDAARRLRHSASYAESWRETAERLQAWRDADILRHSVDAAALLVLRPAVVAAITALGEVVPGDAGPAVLASRLRKAVDLVEDLRARTWLTAEVERLEKRLRAMGDTPVNGRQIVCSLCASVAWNVCVHVAVMTTEGFHLVARTGPYRDPLVVALLQRLCPEIFDGPVSIGGGEMLNLFSDDVGDHIDTILTAQGDSPEESRRLDVLRALLSVQLLLDKVCQ